MLQLLPDMNRMLKIWSRSRGGVKIEKFQSFPSSSQEPSWAAHKARSVRRIILILVVVALLLVGGFIVADPTFRYPLMGVQLDRPLQGLAGKDAITMQVSLDTGTELVSEDQLRSEPAVQDSFNLLLILSEDVQPKSESANVLYKVEEMQSEQWAWKKAELNKLQARTQIFPKALATTPVITVPKTHELAESDVWTPFMMALWPKLPEGFQKAGKSSWSDQFSYTEKTPLGGDPVKINCQLVYKMDKFLNTNYGVYANLLVLGTLQAASGQDPSLKVTGTFKGFAMLDPDTGRVAGGEYRIEQQVMVHKPNLPIARTTTYQGVRYWRPKFHQGMQGPKTAVPAATPGTTAAAGS